MAKSRVIVKSNFRRVPGAATEGLKDAVEAWKDEGEAQAKSNLTRKESQRGYSLDSLYSSIGSGMLGDLNAHFFASEWYARFFEYGTVHLVPMPFLRPAKTKADRKFQQVAGTSVERAIRRRASV